MSEMIEKVARALCLRAGHAPDVVFRGAPYWRTYVEDARVAIEAMKEPTEGMVRAVPSLTPLGPVWSAMVSVALGE